MSNDNDILTEDQVATQFGLTVATLRNWRSQRRGPTATKVGRRCFYRRETLMTWIASREGAHRAEAPKKASEVRASARHGSSK